MLGRLIQWRIPGVRPGISYDELFHSPPFTVLQEGEHSLIAGIVGRIWTLRRDYPTLRAPEEFLRWATPGTARVLFANWVEPGEGGRALRGETRAGARRRGSHRPCGGAAADHALPVPDRSEALSLAGSQGRAAQRS